MKVVPSVSSGTSLPQGQPQSVTLTPDGRLAPQDYHRFHSPVSGTVGKMTMIGGEYYTVNPQAIRTSLDVYGENARKVVPIQSDDFGLVMTVWVGAMSEPLHCCRLRGGIEGRS